ncbi:MAG: ROK family transcriptional regulator [Eubacteriales bacterium]|nr:ROK family transcriptional regulator [Eubacteriales bacterium]
MTRSSQVNNADGMLLKNQIAILQHIQRGSCVTRTQLAEHTGLTRAGVSKITAQLIEAGIVEEAALLTGKKGRRSIGLSITEGGNKIIGVKLSRRNYSIGVFSFSGQLLEKTNKTISIDDADEEIFSQIQKIVLGYIKNDKQIVAVGVAVPGPFLINEKKILLISELDKKARRDLSVANMFNDDAFKDIPVIISHDANAGAMADWWFGIEKKDLQGCIVHFLVGEGVGAGVIYNGEIINGSQGTAAEIGHISIDYKGPDCVCGNCGCLEMYCSSLAFLRFCYNERKNHPDSKLNDYETLTTEIIFSLSDEGDTFAQECVKRAGFYIGLGCVNIINGFNPNTIFICNEMSKGGKLLLDEINNVVQSRILKEIRQNVSIELSTFDGDDILFGAAAVAIDFCLKRPEFLTQKNN